MARDRPIPPDGDSTVEYLTADSEVLDRRARARRPRLVLILVLALALVGAAGWLLGPWHEPTLSATQVSGLYAPPPQPELNWSPATAMSARISDVPGAPTDLGTVACRESAPALFNYLPPGGVDGYLAPFGRSADRRFGISSTARFPDVQTAEQSFSRLVANLDQCTQLVLAAQYGSFQLEITGTPVTQSRFDGHRVQYALTSRNGDRSEFSTLIGLQLGNTVTWQSRDRPPGLYAVEDADQAVDALVARIRAADRS